jgi:hypothetical protein
MSHVEKCSCHVLFEWTQTTNTKSSFLAINWTIQGPTMLEVSPDKSDSYFIGALIALSASIFSAANNIIMAKLGRGVPTSVQVHIFMIHVR